jgi:hypothetical protein
MKLALASCLTALFLFVSSAKGGPPIGFDRIIHAVRAQREPSLERENRVLRVKLRKARRSARINGRRVRRLQREARRYWRPSVLHAISLASTIWGVPRAELVSVGSCESHLYPLARNGRYRGVMQEGPMFEHGPFGRAGFSVFDPYANVFTAAYTVARAVRAHKPRWGQWECKP